MMEKIMDNLGKYWKTYLNLIIIQILQHGYPVDTTQPGRPRLNYIEYLQFFVVLKGYLCWENREKDVIHH